MCTPWRPALTPPPPAARRLWREYFPTVDGVVYIVDANDRARFPEAKRELDSLLTGEELQRVPFVVLGNKIDIPGAASEHELRSTLGLMETTGKEEKVSPESGVRPLELFMCSVVRKMGYADGAPRLPHTRPSPPPRAADTVRPPRPPPPRLPLALPVPLSGESGA